MLVAAAAAAAIMATVITATKLHSVIGELSQGASCTSLTLHDDNDDDDADDVDDDDTYYTHMLANNNRSQNQKRKTIPRIDVCVALPT